MKTTSIQWVVNLGKWFTVDQSNIFFKLGICKITSRSIAEEVDGDGIINLKIL